MAFLSRERLSDYRKEITIAVVVCDLCLLFLYYARISSMYQGFDDAYAEVFFLEMHQLYGIVFSLIFVALGLAFYFAWFKFLYGFQMGISFLMLAFVTIGNLFILGADVGIMYITLENQGVGFASAAVSDMQYYVFIGAGVCFAIFHQLTAYVTVWGMFQDEEFFQVPAREVKAQTSSTTTVVSIPSKEAS